MIWRELLNQPVRAVVGLCRANYINFEFKRVTISKGACTKKEELTLIDPLQNVPVIWEIDFKTGKSLLQAKDMQ